MGRTKKRADGLNVPNSLLKRLRACLPDESYTRCVEYLRQNDYGSVLLILSAETIETETEWRDARANVDKTYDSLRERWRASKRLHDATKRSIGVNKAIKSLLVHLRKSKISDSFVYDILGI